MSNFTMVFGFNFTIFEKCSRKMASGQYCVIFTDDDLFAERYVERMVTQM